MGLVFVAALLVIAADALKLPPRFALDALRDWQDLIGGAMSLLAAVFAGNYVLSQMRQVDVIEAERGRRAEVAARAVLPLSLSALSAHAQAVAVICLGLVGGSPRVRRPKAGMAAFPPPPNAVIPDLQAFVLVGPLPLGEEVAAVISDLQVLHAQGSGVWARLESPDRLGGVHRGDLVELVARAAVIYARVGALFPYARREGDGINPITARDVENALNLMGAYPDVYPDIAKRALSLAKMD